MPRVVKGGEGVDVGVGKGAGKGGGKGGGEEEEYDVEWMRESLSNLPVSTLYPDIAEECVATMKRWRSMFPRRVWIRVMRKDRILKEINEIAPLIQEFRSIVATTELEEGAQFTVVDLCCGYGYLSMFLSEMLPADKVSRFVLVDKQWPMRDHETLPHHINPDHLNLPGVWKTRMHTRKVNIKKASEAIGMFNTHPNLAAMVLKPCCLPGKQHAKNDEVWTVGQHTFAARDVYHRSNDNKGHIKFRQWTNHLYEGFDIEGRYKMLEFIHVQPHHCQNLYIFVRRPHPLPGCVPPPKPLLTRVQTIHLALAAGYLAAVYSKLRAGL